MYRRCLFCSSDLGVNEVVEHFPVGRRLAFDAARGRLWAVCRICERWNLTPLEERWEAIEECERIVSGTRRRASSAEISLAKTSEGLDLIRIGRPLRPEFASWRYGDQFGRRKRRTVLRATVGAGLVGGLYFGSLAAFGAGAAMIPIHLFNLATAVRAARAEGTRIPVAGGESVLVKDLQMGSARLRLTRSNWELEIPNAEGDVRLEGAEAVHALGLLLPTVNRHGGSARRVKEAVREIESVGDPTEYFAEAERRARQVGHGHGPLGMLPSRIRFALEMAANEESERTALDGALHLLEQAWRDAEELAAITDDLLVPGRVTRALGRLKRNEGRA